MKQEGMLDRFAKFFWPKEMKELVAKYEAEGTLNEEAVHIFSRGVIKTLLLFVFIGSILILVGGYYWGIPIIIFSPMLTFLDSRMKFKQRMGSYCVGKKIQVIIIEKGNGIYNSQKVLVKNKSTNQHYVIQHTNDKYTPLNLLPEPEEYAEIYCDPSGVYAPTLNLKHLKRIFSFTLTD